MNKHIQQMEGKIIAGKVLYKPLEATRKLNSGIYIPENAKSKQVRGEVVSIGESTEEDRIEVVPGDIIVTSPLFGTKVDIKESEHVLINHRDILYIE